MAGSHWISSHHEHRPFITGAKITRGEQYIYNSRLSFSTLRLRDELYLVCVGFEPEEMDSEMYSPVDNDPAFTVVALSELPVPPRRRLHWRSLYDEVLGLSDESPGYQGHDFDIIVRFFEPYSVLKVLQPTDFNVFRGVFDLLVSNPDNLELPFGQTTVAEFKGLLAAPCTEKLPYGALLASLLAPRWDTCFLQLYRCVERLLAIPQYVEMTKRMSATISLEDFNAATEEILSWRPREGDALEMLLDQVSDASKEQLMRVVSHLPGLGQEAHPAKVFYKARNILVHGQYEYNAIDMPDVDWNILVRATLMFIRELHDIYLSKL